MPVQASREPLAALAGPTRRNVNLLAYLGVTLAIGVVGAIDTYTGPGIHVVSLYFIPLAFAGWRLGRLGAVLASLLSTLVWLSALYSNGVSSPVPYVWTLNFLTQGVAFTFVSVLVAVLAEALRKAQFLSRTDLLTGLLSRQAFIEQASIALSLCRRRARPVALAFLDLDNFKSVNDSCGHARGDALLRACGKTIAGELRASDIAARFGGDEFVILLPEANTENVMALLDRLRDLIQISPECKALGVTASIGAVVNEPATADIEELIAYADAQMYEVKNGSKNRVSVHTLGQH